MANESVTVENPYGLSALWAQGDFIAKGVLILLALMSAYSWFIIFTKWWEQRRLLKQAAEADKNFWGADNIKNGVGKLTGKGNIFKAIASEAIDAAEHHDTRMTQQVPLHEWIDNVIARGVARIASALQTQLPFLATTGSTAPFIGLFGTVWGIYHALVAIGVAGQASIDKVAGPVGEALIMTAIEGQTVLQRPRAGDRLRLARRRLERQGHLGRQEVTAPRTGRRQSP
jgi:biopolymer transport protein ExbB